MSKKQRKQQKKARQGVQNAIKQTAKAFKAIAPLLEIRMKMLELQKQGRPIELKQGGMAGGKIKEEAERWPLSEKPPFVQYAPGSGKSDKIGEEILNRVKEGLKRDASTMQATEDNKVYANAMRVVTTALDADKSPGSMYYSWQSNIATAFMIRVDEMGFDSGLQEDLRIVANEAAKNFLELLIRPAFSTRLTPHRWAGFNPDPPKQQGEYEVVHVCGTKSIQYWNGGAWNCEFPIEGWRDIKK